MRLVDSVHRYLAEVLSKLIDDVFAGFPRLGAEVHSQVKQQILNTCISQLPLWSTTIISWLSCV